MDIDKVFIILTWIYLSYTSTTWSSEVGNLTTYHLASFAIPDDLYSGDNECDECRPRWNHFAIHKVTGDVYVGGSDILVHLHSNFTEKNRVFTRADDCIESDEDGRKRRGSPSAQLEDCLDMNKLLTIYYDDDKLITCGSEKGKCQIRNTDNISIFDEDELNDFIVPSGNGTTAYTVRGDKLYIAATRDPERPSVPPVRRLQISGTDTDRISLQDEPDGKVLFTNTSNSWGHPFVINYVGEFVLNSFVYFVTSPSPHPQANSENKRFNSKLNRVCHNATNFDGFAETTIGCIGNHNDAYNLVQAAYVGKVGYDLATSISVDGDDVLYAVFAQSVREGGDKASNKSALCVFNLDDIERTFIDAIVACFRNGSSPGSSRAIGYLQQSRSCENKVRIRNS